MAGRADLSLSEDQLAEVQRILLKVAKESGSNRAKVEAAKALAAFERVAAKRDEVLADTVAKAVEAQQPQLANYLQVNMGPPAAEADEDPELAEFDRMMAEHRGEGRDGPQDADQNAQTDDPMQGAAEPPGVEAANEPPKTPSEGDQEGGEPAGDEPPFDEGRSLRRLWANL